MKFKRTQFKSPSTYGEYGYYNIWGGFHSTTDTYAYKGILKAVIKALLQRKVTDAKNLIKLGYEWIWVHRACDTSDFHHNLGCWAKGNGHRFELLLDNMWYNMKAYQRYGGKEKIYSRVYSRKVY